jgi:glycosyltransferase involved in cell wall biosynthesis
MKITFGMATYDDYHGVWFTTRALERYQDFRDSDEIIVVDNNPSSRHGVETKNLCLKLGIKYIEYPQNTGTTQSRQAIFDNATGDIVICVDPHVMLGPDAIKNTREYFEKHPDSKDICSGPMILDDGWHFTHFDLRWRGQMWGTWGTAWDHPLGKFSPQKGENDRCSFIALDPAGTDITQQWGMPDIPFPGHQMELIKLGFKPAALRWCGFVYSATIVIDGKPVTDTFSTKEEAAAFLDRDQSGRPKDKIPIHIKMDSRFDESADLQPFEIPAQGLGLFCCLKKSWVVFNKDFRGFGGEEGYIHEKFRRHGGRALCLPWLTWDHRFGRPDGQKYPLTLEHKVRNYVLGFQELGLPLDEIKEHFLSEGMREQWWDLLLQNPAGMQIDTSKPAVSPKGRPQLQPQPAHVFDMDGVYEWCRSQKRDLDEHMPALKRLASNCNLVVEMTKRRESTIALAASSCKQLISFQEENDALLDYAERYANKKIQIVHYDLNKIPEPFGKVDMLFIDTRHNGKRLRQELALWAKSVDRYIVLHDTALHHETGDDNGEGLFPPMRELVEEGEWFVMSHTRNQYGLTVLARQEQDKPEEPVIPWPLGYGPGTEMFNMLKELGVADKPGCSCRATAEKMDIWGVEGCRNPENFTWILSQVDKNAEKWSWAETLKIAAANLSKPGAWKLAWRLNPMELHKSLIEEAIRRFEEKGPPGCGTKCQPETCKKPSCKRKVVAS